MMLRKVELEKPIKLAQSESLGGLELSHISGQRTIANAACALQYGGSPVKVGEEEYSLFRDHELLAKINE